MKVLQSSVQSKLYLLRDGIEWFNYININTIKILFLIIYIHNFITSNCIAIVLKDKKSISCLFDSFLSPSINMLTQRIGNQQSKLYLLANRIQWFNYNKIRMLTRINYKNVHIYLNVKMECRQEY
eukprot:492866_1